MSKLNVLNLGGMSILKALHLEEALLRCSKENWFIFNHGHKQRNIVVGFSGKVIELVHTKEAHKQNIQTIRRYTGGGTVITDENTMFTTFIMNANEAKCRPYPREIMTWSADYIFSPVFARALSQRPSYQFSLREHDYAINDKKVGGNAQSIVKDRWVHHTSFLWDFDPSNMALLQIPKKRPEYRQSRGHESFVARLNAHFDSPSEFEQMILSQLATQYTLTEINVEDCASIEQELLSKVTDRSQIIRTKVEDLTSYFDESLLLPSLIKMGPSCINI